MFEQIDGRTGTTNTKSGHKRASIVESNKLQEAVGDHDQREKDIIYLSNLLDKFEQIDCGTGTTKAKRSHK